MSPELYLLTMSLFLGTILLVFGMKYASAAFAARARIANDTAYRQLADRVVDGQAQSQTTLAAIRAELGHVSASLATVEKILSQVG